MHIFVFGSQRQSYALWAGILVWVACITGSLSYAAEPKTYFAYYEQLLNKVRELNLSSHPYWLRLGHYKRRRWGGYQSEADGPLFFMSPSGRENPQAELEATLFGIVFGDYQRPQEQHPRCRFPERYYWLRNQLQIEEGQIPPVICERYQSWRDTIKIESVSFVFASYYVNNPSSMFGHTFLKLNREGTAKNRELIDYGLNFAANPTTDNALLYAINGIFGGFPGTYSLFPYYLKVREYNDFESRDLWEYPLVLSREETERLLRHSWELGSTWFDYYYFDENCSYQILTLLEVVRPELNLSDQYFYVVQPVDTVKQLVRIPGLTHEVRYRPSQFNKYLAYFNMLTAREQNEFLKGEKQKTPPDPALPMLSRAAIIDTHIEYHNFRYFSEAEIPSEQKKFLDTLLSERAAMGRLSDARKPVYQTPEPPTAGHESTTWKLSAFQSTQGYGTALLLRPALRELADAPLGYSPFSQVILFDMGLRFYPEVRALPFFDFLNFADIISLSPLTRAYWRPSWAVRFGLQSLQAENMSAKPHDKMNFYLEAGGGFTFPLLPHLSWFTLLQVRGELSPAFATNGRIAPVITSGLLLRLWQSLSFLSRVDVRHYVFTADLPVVVWQNKLNWGLNRRLALEAAAELSFVEYHPRQRQREEISLAVKVYL